MKVGPGLENSFHGKVEELRGRKDPEAMKAVARELESIFALEMIKAMRATTSSESKGLGNDTYMSMFDMELAKLFADRGLGLRDMLLKGLRREVEKSASPASRSEAGEVKSQKAVNSQESPVKSQKDEVTKEFISKKTPPSPLSSPSRGEDGSKSAPPLRGGDEGEGDICGFTYGLFSNIPVDGVISSGFGMRKHPVYGDNRFHHGVDIAASEGTEIYPLRNGKVIFSGVKSGYGNVVVIDHGDGLSSKYAHNRANFVKEGDIVDTDTVIGQVGSTGSSTGPHLHFEVIYKDKRIDPAMVIAMK